MTRADRQGPNDPTGKPERETARDRRRAEALRANLKRRKAQLRDRKGGQTTDAEPTKDEP